MAKQHAQRRSVDVVKSKKKNKDVPGQTTGNVIGKKGSKAYRYWNPELNDYVQVADPQRRWPWDNLQAFRRGDEGALDMCWYVNQHGTHVRGVRPLTGMRWGPEVSEYGDGEGQYIMHVTRRSYENPEFITGRTGPVENPHFEPDYKGTI